MESPLSSNFSPISHYNNNNNDMNMAFVSPLALVRAPQRAAACTLRPATTCAAASPGPAQRTIADVAPSTTHTQVYGPADDVCTFGEECQLTEACVTSSPALERIVSKYVLPMREENTQVFFDNNADGEHTVALVFAHDRHGLVLDIVSVLKALSVRVHRMASSESDALRLLFHRIEGELVSIGELGLSVDNCVALWLTDEASGEKIYDEGHRLDQLTQCIKLELDMPYPRPRPAHDDCWHRVSVQKNRAERYTVFSIQTPDRPGLLVELSNAFNQVDIDVASASIKTCASRVENHFFVTKRGFKEPLFQDDIELALEHVMRALHRVGDPDPNETLWYQTRDGTAATIAEAIFIDEVNNRELACFKFSEFETPNFRGRLPEAPYRPILSP